LFAEALSPNIVSKIAPSKQTPAWQSPFPINTRSFSCSDV